MLVVLNVVLKFELKLQARVSVRLDVVGSTLEPLITSQLDDVSKVVVELV